MSETDYWDLYVTNTQTLYPSQNPLSEILIRLYGRTRSGDTKTVTVKGFEPFFYTEEGAREEVTPASNERLERYEDTDVLPLSDRFDDITPWREERNLVKVVADQPSNVPELRSHFDKTWAADTIFEERFRVESGIRTGVRVPASSGDDTLVEPDELEPVEIEDVNPRVLTLDIETDDRDSGFPSPGEARILSIASHDSYEDELIVFVDRNGQSFSDFLGLDSEEAAALDEGELTLDDLGLDFDRLVDVDSEQDMLRTFSSFLSSLDPDLVCGWNSGDDSNDGFDLPHIIERMAGFGIGPGRLARDGSVEVSDYDEVTIGGRSTYDLMDGWEDTKFTNPTSKRLEYVANQALDDAKIPHPELGYYEMYEQETRKFLNYNAKDTELTVRINEQENVLGFKKRLKDMIGVDWERTHQNNEFIEMSIRRKLREHDLTMVTAYDNEWVQKELESGSDGVNYEGAYVFPSFAGLLANILGLDLASLYPMTQWMLNASPDTRIDREKAFKHDIPHVVAENGQCFRDDVDGIIRELVDEYRQVKKEFKQRRNNAEYGTAEWDEFAEAYNVTKTIYNSYYGYSGWDKSPLYNPHDAAAVTLTSQRVIKRTAEYIDENTPAEVVYGDTDSNYVQFPEDWEQEETLEYAEELCETLSEELYPKLCDEFLIPREKNRWLIEVEMRAERFFMSGSKKHYAYLKTWDEGDDFDDVINADGKNDDLDLPVEVPDTHGKFSVTGYAPVKSNFSPKTKETQGNVLEAAVRGADESDISEIIHEAAAGISVKDPDWMEVGMPQGLGQKLDAEESYRDDYYAFTNGTPQGAHPRGAWFANQLLDVDYGQDSKPRRVYLDPTLYVESAEGEQVPVDVVAFETEEDLEPIEDELKMDATAMQEKTLRNPLSDICDALGIDIDAAFTGQQQTGLESFL
jgi:DNA polymerase I